MFWLSSVAVATSQECDNSHSVADNIVDQQLNPKQANQIWAGVVTYRVPGVQQELTCL